METPCWCPSEGHKHGCPSEFRPPRFGPPGTNQLAVGPLGTNPLVDLDPRGTKSVSGFSPCSQIWTPPPPILQLIYLTVYRDRVRFWMGETWGKDLDQLICFLKHSLRHFEKYVGLRCEF